MSCYKIITAYLAGRRGHASSPETTDQRGSRNSKKPPVQKIESEADGIL